MSVRNQTVSTCRGPTNWGSTYDYARSLAEFVADRSLTEDQAVCSIAIHAAERHQGEIGFSDGLKSAINTMRQVAADIRANEE